MKPSCWLAGTSTWPWSAAAPLSDDGPPHKPIRRAPQDCTDLLREWMAERVLQPLVAALGGAAAAVEDGAARLGLQSFRLASLLAPGPVSAAADDPPAAGAARGPGTQGFDDAGIVCARRAPFPPRPPPPLGRACGRATADPLPRLPRWPHPCGPRRSIPHLLTPHAAGAGEAGKEADDETRVTQLRSQILSKLQPTGTFHLGPPPTPPPEAVACLQARGNPRRAPAHGGRRAGSGPPAVLRSLAGHAAGTPPSAPLPFTNPPFTPHTPWCRPSPSTCS